MECRQCASPLERPGDYCLVCRTANADTVVLELARERATVTTLDGKTVLGRHVVTTTPEPSDSKRTVAALRNFAGEIADEVRRKRPEEVYATGDRDVLGAVRAQLHFEFYRVPAEDPVEHVRERRGDAPLEVVEATVAASRLGVPGFDDQRLRARIDHYGDVVDSCAGPRERAAWDRFDDLVDRQPDRGGR